MRGLESDGIVAAQASEDNKLLRFIFQQGADQFWVSLPAANLEPALAIILTVATAVQKDDSATPIDIKHAHVGIDANNDLILRLENEAGALMSFRLPRSHAFQLSGLLEEVLRKQAGSSEHH